MKKENLKIGGIEFIQIPKGRFLMGSQDDDDLAYGDEKPQHTLEIHYDYWTGKYPVSNHQFREFVHSTSYVTRAEKDGWCWVWNSLNGKWEKVKNATWKYPTGENSKNAKLDNHPVVQVCWYDAMAFCEWLNEKKGSILPQGYHFHLPNEAEWEKAARGPAGREWPWGNDFNVSLCNSKLDGKVHTISVGSHSPQGDSIYGVADMSGNIWEWTITLWGNDRNTPSYVYPYESKDGRENLSAGDEFFRIIRGGSFKDDIQGVRSACRDIDPPNYSLNNLGVRVFVIPITKAA
jgi:formylglycine-generating enzyme required for sulfatase activity